MKNLKAFMILLVSVATLVSCNDDTEYVLPPLQGKGDVFVRCIKDGDEIKYAPVLYAMSNYYIDTAIVAGPGANGSDYQLSGYWGDKSVFRSVPENEDFTTSDITNGIYEFEIVSGLDTLDVEDKLLDSRIDPMEITDLSYEQNTHEFDITWNEIENADVYVVKIMDGIDGRYLYVSDRLSKTEHEFSQYSRGWSNFEKTAGKTYVLGVFAYEFEDKDEQSGSDLNSESVEYREIEW